MIQAKISECIDELERIEDSAVSDISLECICTVIEDLKDILRRSKTNDPRYELVAGQVVYTNGVVGAVLETDEQWHPFRYFDSGKMDVSDDGHFTPSGAYKMAGLMFT